MPDALPPHRSVLAVCAHPDDESFGLGAVLSTFADAGARLAVLCFTHGEASTLGTSDADLAAIRATELAEAGTVLGVDRVELLDHPDGALAEVPLDELVAPVLRLAEEVGADVLVTFDRGGITGHPDHQRATDAAVAAARDLALPVLAWTVPADVADALVREGAPDFVGRAEHEVDLVISVDRRRQLEAIRLHRSQSADNPLLWRRLELLGTSEHLRRLR